ncbi:ATP-binding protein [Yersinia enterocolitica]|uniref:Cell division protein FtsK n=1 Tax=Yersinia massiliensis TaxID=419257 RepID=A0ABM6UXM9_9GAMM|nr:ATP-binding protein [Yersinia massiliensis]AVX39642.1 cell division protein FtsK [Yersinia massiliensis]EKN3956729.1 ATP-binding protein [Yersinia enterocolitica]EKN3999508.1 ATP-binding protein [Yersinia enterocolitica]EKN6082177.1 ATP-binding protein [Yersinia enterocolitica]
MSNQNFSSVGVLRGELKVGVVSSVSAQGVKINLTHAGEISGSYMSGGRYGKGEVGEILLIEGQQSIILGRLIEVKLPERDRNEVSEDSQGKYKVDAIGYIQLLGSINTSDLKVESGIKSYPRLGDRVFSAPLEFVSLIPELINKGVSESDIERVTINLGAVSGGSDSYVRVTPEKLFGRHCAVLGATGGGKSWTTSKIIEECSQYNGAKIIIVDATSEYRSFDSEHIVHYHLGTPLNIHKDSSEFRIPPTDFMESDFIAMFDPSGKVQGPKLKEAIKSLRLVALDPTIATNGILMKIKRLKTDYRRAMNTGGNSKLVDNPSQPFDVTKIIPQIVQECCWDEQDSWGNPTADLGYCSSLLTRIQAVIYSNSLKSVFHGSDALNSLGGVLEDFLNGDKRVLRVCLSDVSYEFYAREILANVIGRKLLILARAERFREKPLLVIVDEAHNFLGKRVGAEDHSVKLDAFEMIAKEGRKYGLNICLTTQRPRDITEGVLSQIGTLLVHRLTNDRDREVVERACGEIDKSAAAFLPSLKQGEVALVGVDFPIPMTIQIGKPMYPPESDSPSFQDIWKK